MNEYEDQIEVREEKINGVGHWHWIKGDTGAWEGPKNNWLGGMSDAYYANVKKFDYVVTAGANQGMYARLHAEKFKTVYAFEPDPLNFHCLNLNTQVPNVIKMQVGLSDHCGQRWLERFDRCNSGMHKIAQGDMGDKCIPVQCITLDSLNLPGCDLIQLDVEGHELSVLCGAMTLIMAFRPVISGESCRNDIISEFFHNIKYKHYTTSHADDIWIPK